MKKAWTETHPEMNKDQRIRQAPKCNSTKEICSIMFEPWIQYLLQLCVFHTIFFVGIFYIFSYRLDLIFWCCLPSVAAWWLSRLPLLFFCDFFFFFSDRFVMICSYLFHPLHTGTCVAETGLSFFFGAFARDRIGWLASARIHLLNCDIILSIV